MPYHITATKFQSFENDYQYLAVGLVDGAIVVIDLTLGIEKFFLEKHPTSISSMAFYENKSLISGSICGRINISDLENMERQNSSKKEHTLRFSMCQNCQDRRIPIANVNTSEEFGLGMAIDIEGNCRFYDLRRFKKMAKVNASGVRIDGDRAAQTKFRLLGDVCVTMTNDAFLGIIQGGKIFKDE
jgi:WD40 repeat protein